MLLVRFDTMQAYVLRDGLDITGAELKAAAERLARDIAGRLDAEEEATLFLIFDAMVPKIATLLEALYLDLADRVRYLGVNAGSETFKPTPCLFDGERVIRGGVLALLLTGRREAALEHGFLPPAELVAATSTDGNRIMSIDWRPAFDVYSERIQSQYQVEITKENFYEYAVHFPFGIMRANGEVLVRIPVALFDDGSLFCVGEVPENSILTLLESPKPGDVRAAKVIAEGLPARGGELLTFYCAGRRIHLGEAAHEELRSLSEYTGGAALAGALSLGEIGSSRQGGYPLFHNAAVLCLRL